MSPSLRTSDDFRAVAAALDAVTAAHEQVRAAEAELGYARHERASKAEAAVEAGASLDAIADAAGVSRDGVRKWLDQLRSSI